MGVDLRVTIYLHEDGRLNELARLDREIDKISIEVKKLSGKLSNAKFVDNAPAEVVAKERQKLEEFEGSVSQLQEKRSAIAEMA